DELGDLLTSGSTDTRSHIWAYAGTYNIKVKALDEYGAESSWSTSITIKIDNIRIDLYPTDDALIKHDNPDANYGSSVYFEIRNDYGYRGSSGWAWNSLIKFDVSSISSRSTVSSAYLVIYYYNYFTTNPVGRTLRLYRATSLWNENTITWNNQPSYPLLPTTSSTVPSSFGWMTWDVTRDVQDFIDGTKPNYGWKITDNIYWGKSDIPETVFYPKEYSDSNYHPKLEIVITN
ncbi:MAG: DNRLRE domain-containing protein, partial [Candidatus Thermoplasmatota archaeon]|nr:DNRLRE domain-containing protein [Candidatus Thermoplasmatota archaeon]